MKQKMFVICSSIAALHLVIGGAVMLGGCSVVEPDEPMPPRAYIPEAKPVVEKTDAQFPEKAPETIETPKVEDPVVITTEPEKPVVLPPVAVKPVVKVPQKGDPAPTVSKKPFRANDVVYIVKKNDSYWGIARKFGVSMKDLIAYNTIAPNKLRPGHKIMIPASGKKVTKPAVKPASVKVKKSYAPIPADGIYVVKKNDSFHKIAAKFGLRAADIAEYNNLPLTKAIQPNQKLKLPPRRNTAEKVQTPAVDPAKEEIKSPDTPATDAPATETPAADAPAAETSTSTPVDATPAASTESTTKPAATNDTGDLPDVPAPSLDDAAEPAA